jgi:hypothetical protein
MILRLLRAVIFNLTRNVIEVLEQALSLAGRVWFRQYCFERITCPPKTKQELNDAWSHHVRGH